MFIYYLCHLTYMSESHDTFFLWIFILSIIIYWLNKTKIKINYYNLVLCFYSTKIDIFYFGTTYVL